MCRGIAPSWSHWRSRVARFEALRSSGSVDGARTDRPSNSDQPLYRFRTTRLTTWSGPLSDYFRYTRGHAKNGWGRFFGPPLLPYFCPTLAEPPRGPR